MFKRSSLFLLCSSPILLASACGSSTGKQSAPTTTSQAVAAQAESEDSAEMPAAQMPVEEMPMAAESTPVDADPSNATAAANPSKSQSAVFAGAADKPSENVHAVLVTTDKKAKEVATLEFASSADAVTISGSFENLPKGLRGIKILDASSCDNLSAKVGDFNPTEAKHGPLDSSERHVGDLGNLQVDKMGKAQFELTTDSLTIEAEGASSVLGKVVVVTRNKDNGKSQPAGRAGKAIACGKIEAK